jgi:hypothetical protein
MSPKQVWSWSLVVAVGVLLFSQYGKHTEYGMEMLFTA